MRKRTSKVGAHWAGGLRAMYLPDAKRDVHHRSLAQGAGQPLVSTVTRDGATIGRPGARDGDYDGKEARGLPDRQDHLRGPVPALGGGQLEGLRPRLLEGPRGMGGAQRDPAQVRAVDVLDVLLRRGL